jgi:hypothetical protein
MFGNGDLVNDQELHDQIEKLVAQEHELFDRSAGLNPDERKRLAEINVRLDRLWDLMRQRRAREEFGQDPNQTEERSAEIVESYVE